MISLCFNYQKMLYKFLSNISFNMEIFILWLVYVCKHVIYSTFLIHIYTMCVYVCVCILASCVSYIGQYLRKKQDIN